MAAKRALKEKPAGLGGGLSAADLERAFVRRDPLVWFELHGCILDKKRRKVRHPDLVGNEMQAMMKEVILYCQEIGIPCRIVNLKGRQQGSSTFSVACSYHLAVSECVKVCIIGDEYEKSVKNLETMFADYAREDSFDWGNRFTATNGTFSNGSVLVTETANDPRAGASGTMQCVIATEVAHWKETGVISGKKTFAALLNCVPEEPGTLMIVESTPNGIGGVYHSTYEGAITLEDHKAGRIPRNWNGFFKVFYPWHRHPEYRVAEVGEELEAEILGSLGMREVELQAMGLGVDRLAWRRKMLASPRFDGDEDLFEQEYPADEVMCFLMSGRRAFPLPAVQAMRKRAMAMPAPEFGVLSWTDDTKTKVRWEPVAEDDAWLKTWERPLPGCAYNLPIDPMTGASQTTGGDPDNHGACILRAGYLDVQGVWHNMMMASRLADCWAEKREKRKLPVCKWDIDVLTERSAMLAAWYGGAMVVVETNMDKGIIELLRALYPATNIFRRMIVNRVKQTQAPVFGWKTDTSTRATQLDNLVRRVRLHDEFGDGILVPDLGVIAELGGMIVNKSGKAEAMAGFHDDQVLCLSIGAITIDAAHTMAPLRRSRAEWDPEEDGDGRLVDHSYS